MATGGSSTELGSYGAKCNGSKTTLPDPVHHYNYDLHVKMSKKIAQLTKVIYALNAKSDEHEVSLQAVKETHQEEIQHIIAETRGKILQYKSRMGEEMDLRHQIQTLEDSLQKHKKCKEEVLADFEMYKQQVVEREKNMERENTEKIMALSKEMLDIKKEFESNLQHFMDVQHRLEQDKQSAITEMVKVNQESENLQEKCKTLKGCFDEQIKLEEKHKVEIQNLNQELEILKLEKKRLTTDFEKKVNKLQASHQKELETLKKALQLSVTETLKQWQIEQKKNLQAQEAALQLKLKKLESDMEVKCQMMNEFKNQSHKLQELLNNAQVRIQDLEKQLQKAEKKLTASNLKLQKMEDEAELLRERLLVQEAEILHKTDENKALSLSEHNAQAEVDGLKTHLSELKHKLTEGQLQQQQNTEAEHSQQLTQVIEILSREKEEHHKRHEEELKKLKRVAEEEKLRLKEQLMKGLEELVKKHTTEIKAVQTSMELERKQLQKLTNIKKNSQQQMDTSQYALQLLQSQFGKEKEMLLEKLQCVTALNQDLKSQLQTLKEQTLKTEEKCQQHEIAEGNYQNQLKALEEDLSKSQSETSKLQREKLLLQEALSRLKKEIESSNQKTVQHRSEEAQHQKSVQEEFKAQHEKEINFLKQNHLKEIQGIVSDFSSSQTRLQAKIVSLETEVKEMEEKSKKHESKPEDLHRISTLQDKLSERDQIIKKLLDERRFHQLAMANSESSINRCLSAGTFTPTLKKKRTEDLPVRVVSVPNLSSYEKSFLSSESTPIIRFPLMTKSPSLDQSLSSTSRLLNQPSQVQPSKQASSISNEKGKNKETKGKDPQRQEWFTKYFSF
ncbi:protein FAM184B-like isoform X7 [Chiloscyllium punctatum]|uniref:protein FAM184B-like isoform X7 n=1 Tax=Chiloscyllium punctatum TaxID=137246 RepID=UPI003B6384F7